MEPDNPFITTYDRLNEQTAPTASHVNGDICHGFNIAGVHTRDASLLCGGCAAEEEIVEAWKSDAVVQDTGQYNVFAFQCDECEKWIDTYVEVSREMDPNLWHKLVWNQQLGNLDSITLDYEDLCNQAAQEAYNRGYNDAKELTELIDIGSESPEEYAENEPEACEPPTDSAMWANSILPDLRAMSGYVDDMGRGTYTTAPNDTAQMCFDYDVIEAYRHGWYDKCVGNDKSDDY